MKDSYSILPNKLKEFPFIDRGMWTKEKDQMARKAVKKPVKRAAPKKQYVVGFMMSMAGEMEFLMGVYDTLQKAKDEAERTYDNEGETYHIFEVKLVAQTEKLGRLHWKGK